MDNKAIYEDALPSPLGNRFCSTCYQYKSSIGGKWKIALHGKNRRWLCEECIAKRIKPTKVN